MSDPVPVSGAMTFTDSVRICFAKFGAFRGRAGRPEFWWFVLFCFVGSIALGVVSDALSFAFTLVTLIPMTAVTNRRLHDTDRSGWLQLVGLIPILGWILILVWCAEEGKTGNEGDPGA